MKYYEINKQEIGSTEDLCIGGKVIPVFKHESKCWMRISENGDKKGTLYYISEKETIKGKCCMDEHKSVRVTLKNFDTTLMHEIDRDTFEDGVGL